LKAPMNRISLSRLTDVLQCLRRAPDCFIGFELLEQNNDHGNRTGTNTPMFICLDAD